MCLGEAPSKAGDRYWMVPLSGRPAQVLCEAAWLPREGNEAWYWTLTRHFETLNAIERFADAYPWSAPRARERWTRWLLEQPDGRMPPGNPPTLVVVCVGRKAADAIGLAADYPWFRWTLYGLMYVTVIPHTSGRNRVLNDEAMKAGMGTTLREAIYLAGRPCPEDTNGDGDCGRRYCPACGPGHRIEVYP